MKKRVLIFATTYFPLVGGAEVALRELTERLPEWQFDLICAKIIPGLAKTERVGNIVVHRCGFGKPIDKYLLPLTGVWRALWIVKAKDLAGIWALMASYGGFAALAYTWLHPRIRFLLTLQEGDPLEHYARRVGMARLLHKKIFKRANAVQAISRFLGDWAKRMGFTDEPSIIPNGVDIPRFTVQSSTEDRQSLRQKLNLKHDDIALVTVSRLSLKNGVDDLIRSLTFLPPFYKLLIVGEGEDETKLQRLTEEKGLQTRVTFLGKKNHDEVPLLLHACDIFVRPSLSEGLGNAFLEAMAVGLPVIGTPVGGIPDFLIDGETGIFCQPRNPESIAQAVKRIQEQPGLREKLIEQGQYLVRENYDWNKISKEIEDVITKIANKAS